jgi:hypothetical protein
MPALSSTQTGFLKFLDDFENDTGMEARKNMEAYIHYYNGRMAQKNYEIMWDLLEEIMRLSEKVGKQGET